MKPKNAGFYIDQVKYVQGFQTDLQAAQALGLAASVIVAFRTGRITLDSDIALDVATLAQCSVGEIIFTMKAYKAYMKDKNKIKHQWLALSKEASSIHLAAKEAQ